MEKRLHAFKETLSNTVEELASSYPPSQPFIQAFIGQGEIGRLNRLATNPTISNKTMYLSDPTPPVYYSVFIFPKKKLGDAQIFFDKEHGGYAAFISSMFHPKTEFSKSDCRHLVVYCHGTAPRSWGCLTIIAGNGRFANATTLPFELLNGKERTLAAAMTKHHLKPE